MLTICGGVRVHWPVCASARLLVLGSGIEPGASARRLIWHAQIPDTLNYFRSEFASGADVIVLHYDFESSIGYWLTITTQAYHRAVMEELAPHGITYRQSMVLGWLALEGELSQAELAAKMMIEPPTLVGILDRMERDGWITRHSCPSDRRKKLIRANEAAEPVWEKMVECAARVRARATDGLSERQLAMLKKLLRRIGNNLKTRQPADIAESAV